MRAVTTGLFMLMAVVLVTAGGLVAAENLNDIPERQDVLELGDDGAADSHGYGATTDMGMAATASDRTLRAELEVRTLAEDLQGASNENRTAIAQSYLDRLDQEIETLIATDTEFLDGANKGDITVDDFVRGVTETGALASARQQTMDDLATLDDLVPAIDLTQEATRLEARYDQVASPVRDRILSAASTPSLQTTVTVELTDGGFALASVDERRYYREAFRADRYGLTGDSVGSLATAETIVAETYPSSIATIATREIGSGVYMIERSLPSGAVSAYVHSGSEAVAVERQHRWLEEVDMESAGSITEDDIVLSLERSFVGGPLRVTVGDVETGEAVSGQVYLRHEGTWTPLGAVGEDGSVWGPDPGGPIDIRVVTADGVISLSVDR